MSMFSLNSINQRRGANGLDPLAQPAITGTSPSHDWLRQAMGPVNPQTNFVDWWKQQVQGGQQPATPATPQPTVTGPIRQWGNFGTPRGPVQRAPVRNYQQRNGFPTGMGALNPMAMASFKTPGLPSFGGYAFPQPAPPQQSQPFDLIQMLGDFYQPTPMGDAQNSANSTVGANFIGSYAPPRRF